VSAPRTITANWVKAVDAAKYYTARRMGWKETNVNEQVGTRTAARSKLRT
jgi:hypothetical protein